MESDSERAKRFKDLYRTLLTPVGLIVTVSAVFYVNIATVVKSFPFLEVYQMFIGFSVIALIVSSFLYAVAHTERERYRRRFSQGAFICMMSAAVWSSLFLVVPWAITSIPPEYKVAAVVYFTTAYLTVGLIFTVLFCMSRL